MQAKNAESTGLTINSQSQSKLTVRSQGWGRSPGWATTPLSHLPETNMGAWINGRAKATPAAAHTRTTKLQETILKRESKVTLRHEDVVIVNQPTCEPARDMDLQDVQEQRAQLHPSTFADSPLRPPGAAICPSLRSSELSPCGTLTCAP